MECKSPPARSRRVHVKPISERRKDRDIIQISGITLACSHYSLSHSTVCALIIFFWRPKNKSHGDADLTNPRQRNERKRKKTNVVYFLCRAPREEEKRWLDLFRKLSDKVLAGMERKRGGRDPSFLGVHLDFGGGEEEAGGRKVCCWVKDGFAAAAKWGGGGRKRRRNSWLTWMEAKLMAGRRRRRRRKASE